jgi:hypothetical protein
MTKLPPGSGGAIAALAVLGFCFLFAYLTTNKFSSYSFDPGGKAGEFQPLLAMYVRFAEVVIGLAAGSIVLLVRSEFDGRLSWAYASPLTLLAATIFYAVLFLAFLITDYEAYRHSTGWAYTRLRYSRNQALGWSTLLCFSGGYLWLMVVVIRMMV